MTTETKGKAKLVIREGYKRSAYIPSKEDLIMLINKKEVSVCIIERSRYEDNREEMKVIITHK